MSKIDALGVRGRPPAKWDDSVRILEKEGWMENERTRVCKDMY